MVDRIKRKFNGAFLSAGYRGMFSAAAWVSVFSVISILILSGSGFFKILTDHISQIAQNHAESISLVIMDRESDLIVRHGLNNDSHLDISPANFSVLGQRIRKYLKPFHMEKIKIYNLANTVVYSTDSAVIGDVSKSAYLNLALNGTTTSKLKSKTDIEDFDGEQKIGLDVIETYVPIKSKQGNIIGSFEVYEDVTPYRNELFRVISLSLGTVFLISILAFGILLFIIKCMVKAISEMVQELKQASLTDSLTGLLNRRGLNERMEHELARFRRTKKPISILVADIDYFKVINDTYSHAAGDTVLVEVAQTIKKNIREVDLVGRWGGEEFLLFLVDTSLNGSEFLAEKIREAIEQLVVSYQEHRLKVTLSIGVSAFNHADTDLSAQIKAADHCLYQAKAKGRNCVVLENRGFVPLSTHSPR